MTELLFKLKKEGRCIGYARFHKIDASGLALEFSWKPQQDKARESWEQKHRFAFDSIHPWVCKDRNNKDVFEGDRVRIKTKSAAGVVYWDKRQLGWWVWFKDVDDTQGQTCPLAGIVDDIELLEDQPCL